MTVHLDTFNCRCGFSGGWVALCQPRWVSVHRPADSVSEGRQGLSSGPFPG